MPTPTNYTYSIETDIISKKLNSSRLHSSITASNISIALSGISNEVGSDNFDIGFKDVLSPTEETELDSIVENHSGEIPSSEVHKVVIDENDKSKIQKAISVIVHKPENESFARATHDFCNKTTWYTNSIRVLAETVTPVSGVITLSNKNVIDVIYGNINRQDLLQEYVINVYDDGVLIPHFTMELVEGENVKTFNYVVDHKLGKITLENTPTGDVTVDYSYATNSEWILQPEEGSMLIIEHSEIQFSIDINVNTPLRFEIWVGNPYFAVVGHPYEGIPKIPYQVVQYNSVKDLVNEANLGTGTIPAIGNLPECVVFPFNYATIKPFKYSQGAELRIRAVDDIELDGSFGTATFYLIKRDDT